MIMENAVDAAAFEASAVRVIHCLTFLAPPGLRVPRLPRPLDLAPLRSPASAPPSVRVAVLILILSLLLAVIQKTMATAGSSRALPCPALAFGPLVAVI